MSSEAVGRAVERAARAVAEHEGDGDVFMSEDKSPLAKDVAENYRRIVRIAVGTYAAGIRAEVKA